MTRFIEKTKLIGNVAFYAAIILETLFVILDKSAYILQHETWDFRFTFLLFAIKIATTRYNKKEWFGIVGLIVLGTLSWYITDREEIIRIVAMVVACKDVDIDRILKVVLYETVGGAIILAVLSALGIFGIFSLEAVYRGGDLGGMVNRYCFGMGHPNAFHCMLLMMIILVIAVYGEKMNFMEYAILILLNVVAMKFTDSRTAFLIGTVIILIAMLFKYAKKTREKKICLILSELLSAAVVAWGLFTSIVSIESNQFLWDLDIKLNGRMWYAYKSGGIAHWSIFGLEANQEFFDMGIVRMVYWYGMIPAVVFLSIFFISVYKCWKEKKFGYMIILLSFMMYSIMEAHGVSKYIGRNYSFLVIGAVLPMLFENDKQEISIMDIFGKALKWNKNSN